jgi:RNA polymerase sigma-70 factor (ECF subfamily)
MNAKTSSAALKESISFGQKTDEHLMALLRKGHQEALGELVHRYQNDLFRFCYHYLKNRDVARDMAQETFIRVYTARERFDVSRRFKPWLLCIARNLCVNEYNRKKNVAVEAMGGYEAISTPDPARRDNVAGQNPFERLLAKERKDALMTALEELGDDARELIILRYFQKMSARDIGEVVDASEGAVRTRLHRILKQLRANCAKLREDL